MRLLSTSSQAIPLVSLHQQTSPLSLHSLTQQSQSLLHSRLWETIHQYCYILFYHRYILSLAIAIYLYLSLLFILFFIIHCLRCILHSKCNALCWLFLKIMGFCSIMMSILLCLWLRICSCTFHEHLRRWNLLNLFN